MYYNMNTYTFDGGNKRVTYYTKNDAGEFTEVNTDDMFKERHERWVKNESAKIREDVEKSVRDELTNTITERAEKDAKEKYQPQIDDLTSKNKDLETTILQKTIAAEYGFKPGTEKYLGTGTEEDMRTEADNLKEKFGGGATAPNRQQPGKASAIQTRTGVKVTI